VLGTMKELGEHAVALHQQVGQTVQALGIDQLLILADPLEANALSQGAGNTTQIQFASPDALVAHLKETVQSGDRLLFKASRAVALDRVVDQLVQVLGR
jgi:UDP-N-acetylmuramoyl-tripeptide--D-alanyl-D-alanine ligase